MKVLFLSLIDFDSLSDRNIYTDLLREFIKHGHEVVAISPFERKTNKEEKIIDEGLGKILKVKIGNTQKVNFIEKGISTVLLESQILKVSKKQLKDIKFELILYTTPPITFKRVIEYFKKRDNATTYLLLKDIFPQNAVDLGILSKKGIKGILYSYFRKKECDLYRISDYIGCMSQANVKYILQNNMFIDKKRVEVCPNSCEPDELVYVDKRNVRSKYKLPNDKKIFIYGGNLGKPQGIDFLLECISMCKIKDVFFLIVGNGTEYNRIEECVNKMDSQKVMLMKSLPKKEYEEVVSSCDVGLILLDKRFTIPNFPSRMLSYMQVGMPVLAATDRSTDIGDVIESGEYGKWSEHGDYKSFLNNVEAMCENAENKEMGNNARNYFLQHFTAEKSFHIIVDKLIGENKIK